MKFNVRIYLHTFVDFQVEAKDEEEAIEIASNKEYDMEQLLDNLASDSEEVTPLEFQTKAACYSALRDLVFYKGGYLRLNEYRRPTFTITNPCVAEDGEPSKEITIKSLFECRDDSSPLKAIDTNDECWDVDDYLSKENLQILFNSVK